MRKLQMPDRGLLDLAVHALRPIDRSGIHRRPRLRGVKHKVGDEVPDAWLVSAGGAGEDLQLIVLPYDVYPRLCRKAGASAVALRDPVGYPIPDRCRVADLQD